MAHAINPKHCKLSMDCYITILKVYQSPLTLICYTPFLWLLFLTLAFIY